MEPRASRKADAFHERCLVTECSKFTWLHAVENGEDLGQELPQVGHAIGTRAKPEDGEGTPHQDLLVLDPSIHRDQYVEAALHACEQFAV